MVFFVLRVPFLGVHSVTQRPDSNLQLEFLHEYLFQALCNTLFAASLALRVEV
jgi:hypothetical protein